MGRSSFIENARMSPLVNILKVEKSLEIEIQYTHDIGTMACSVCTLLVPGYCYF